MRCLAMALVAVMACGGDGDDEPQGEPGHFTITGVVRYEDRPQLTSGSLGAAAPKPARGVTVALVFDSNKSVGAETVTDDTGAYTIEFDGFSNANVHILASATSVLSNRPISVVHAQTEVIHGFGGPTFPLASGTQDVLVPSTSGVAEAFNIFDVLVDVMDQIPTNFPGRSPSKLEAYWHQGNDNGTYYFDKRLFLLGDQSDSDGYDDTVILHESGHWIEEVIGRTDSPGGDHDGSPTNPTLAWSEGFSTYFSMAMTGKPIYSDSNANGGFSFNADTSNTKANGAGDIAQNVSEDMVSEILWDLADGPTSDDDGVEGTHPVVTSVESFLQTSSLRQVGKQGVDLVDFLDGYFIKNGLGNCAGARALLDVKHTFPYDYGSIAGTCP